VAGSWRSLPGSQTSWAGRAKVPRKATNLALVAYAAANVEWIPRRKKEEPLFTKKKSKLLRDRSRGVGHVQVSVSRADRLACRASAALRGACAGLWGAPRCFSRLPPALVPGGELQACQGDDSAPDGPGCAAGSCTATKPCARSRACSRGCPAAESATPAPAGCALT
jgi:hypothetical protein